MEDFKMDNEELMMEDEVGKITNALDSRRMDVLVNTILGIDRVAKAIKQAILDVCLLSIHVHFVTDIVLLSSSCVNMYREEVVKMEMRSSL